jgi:hypothetical protein
MLLGALAMHNELQTATWRRTGRHSSPARSASKSEERLPAPQRQDAKPRRAQPEHDQDDDHWQR